MHPVRPDSLEGHVTLLCMLLLDTVERKNKEGFVKEETGRLDEPSIASG